MLKEIKAVKTAKGMVYAGYIKGNKKATQVIQRNTYAPSLSTNQEIDIMCTEIRNKIQALVNMNVDDLMAKYNTAMEVTI